VARTGIYFSDVKRARDQLVAQGRRPSIDAIRAALGDTGSKTTIQKYMRELDTEERPGGHSVSEELLALVAQLAEQLKLEAGREVEAIHAQVNEMRVAHDTEQAKVARQLADEQKAAASVSEKFAKSEAQIEALKAQLHAEQIARSNAEQHAIDLQSRLGDAERHQASLENKHQHARDALEHFRTAAKEQREQEARRHEQQVQAIQADLRQAQLALAVKQEDVTRLNKEAAVLATELGANKQALYLEKETGRKLARKVELLQETEARTVVLEAQLAESRIQVADANASCERAQTLCSELRDEKTRLEIAVASSHSASALEERLAKLDQAMFGKSGASARTSPVVDDGR
jgi:hypothetical protein